MLEWDAATRSSAYELVFVPEPWNVITDCQILKKPGVYDVEKMRTIALMPADFNMNNKKLGRDTMMTAEETGVLVDEQYGSRKGRSSTEAARDKVLAFNLIKMQLKPTGWGGLDNFQCYDNMTSPMTSLALVTHGAPKSAVKSMYMVLLSARHHVTTAFGISKKFYGGPKALEEGKDPAQGIGQGNGNAPPGFVTTSSTMVKVHKRLGHGLQLLSALSCLVIA